MNPVKPRPPLVDLISSRGYGVYYPIYKSGFKVRIWPKGETEKEEAFPDLQAAFDAVEARK